MTRPMTRRQVIELHQALDSARAELGILRWELALQLDIDPRTLRYMAWGVASGRTIQFAAAWLHRHTSPPSTTHETTQGGNDHDTGDSA